MKKQILILTLFVAAFLVGNNAFGQSGLASGHADYDYLDGVPTYCPTARPIDCGAGGDALAPLPGVSYPYTITSPTTTGNVHWFVADLTADPTIIDAQGNIAATIEPADGSSPYILTADGAYNDVTTPNTSKTVNITWKAFDGLANTVVLVVYNVDDANCTDNMEIYRIIPQYNFTLDIASIADDGVNGAEIDEAPVEDCVNPIQSASYDGTDLTVDYGTDYVFFAVNAANWQHSWMPGDFSVTSDYAGSTPVITGWAYPADAATTGAWNTVGTDPVLASGYPAGVSVDGFVAEACIIVRVQVDHGSTIENILGNETITLTVNGDMYNAETLTYDNTYPDLEDGGGAACPSDLTSDATDYILTPRPDIDESTPTPFETKTPSDD
ncbi:hypothetical protein [uncultured Draconibacterium sp.]|uniref:hypothetical protein n=1 Tax=uncultured Draconibacterium sp. TaxID=1573823 RepID=UPI0029C86454|nr:hypothetical protein [uncultured Draconibacterium sp.]